MANLVLLSDAFGMNVANIKSINERAQAMSETESNTIRSLSIQYLQQLSRIVHAPNLANPDTQNTCREFAQTILNMFQPDNAHNFESFVEFDKQQGQRPDTISKLQTTLNSISALAFNPITIIESIADKNGLSDYLTKIFLTLDNFNPLYINDVLAIKCCNKRHCACRTLRDYCIKGRQSEPAVETMVKFFFCINHDITSWYPGEPLPDNSFQFPLKVLMEQCVLSVSNYTERGIVTMMYVYLIFSRLVPKTGDLLNKIIYVLFVRFILKSSELLFYRNENDCSSEDHGTFCQYITGLIPAVLVSASTSVYSAHRSWKDTGLIRGVCKLLTVEDATHENYINIHNALVEKLQELSQYSRWHRSKNTRESCDLTQIRSVKRTEKYVPFGRIRVSGNATNGREINASKVSLMFNHMSKSHSTGQNVVCNVFELIPLVPGLEKLGSDRNMIVHDQCFLNPSTFAARMSKDGDTSNGRFLGYLLGVVNAIVDRCPQTDLPGSADKLLQEVLEDVVFDKSHMLSRLILTNVNFVPNTHQLESPNISQYINKNIVSSPLNVLLSLWQRPSNTYSSNINALNTVMLELLANHVNAYSGVIHYIFFCLERVISQICFETVQKISEFSESLSATETVNQAAIVNGCIDEAIVAVKQKWFGNDNEGSEASPAGKKRNAEGKVTSDTLQTPGVNASSTCYLFKIMCDIEEKNWIPSAIIGYSSFLKNQAVQLNDLILKISKDN